MEKVRFDSINVVTPSLCDVNSNYIFEIKGHFFQSNNDLSKISEEAAGERFCAEIAEMGYFVKPERVPIIGNNLQVKSYTFFKKLKKISNGYKRREFNETIVCLSLKHEYVIGTPENAVANLVETTQKQSAELKSIMHRYHELLVKGIRERTDRVQKPYHLVKEKQKGRQLDKIRYLSYTLFSFYKNHI